MARWWLAGVGFWMGCSGGDVVEAPQRPGFVDVAAAAGVALRTVSGSPEKEHIVECNTGGTALFDYDGDGDIDIFIVNGSRLGGYDPASAPRSELYRN
ncbi:MAG: hypothetical protein QGH25_21145, partial [Candidatus Latescibacteria bacterium]|nr:hypothetical protein [Candidatus Latescibacterota bacterium]